METEAINQALNDYTPTNNRSQVSKVASCTVIMDCYNANPTSMLGALENFAAMEGSDKLAIIGDMKELGDISEEEHLAIAKWVDQNDIDTIFVGSEFSKVVEGKTCYENVEAFIEKPGDYSTLTNQLVLLKGSRGIKLESLVDSGIFQ